MSRRRVNGPYKHGFKWRLILVGEDGSQVVESFGTEDEAAQEKRRILKKIEEHSGITVARALDTYELYMREKGNKPRSIETTRGRIEKFFVGHLDRPILAMTEAVCREAYESLKKVYSVDSHRNTLSQCRTFFKWCAAKPRKWITKNPLTEIQGEGKRSKGKPQLRIDECRKFIAAAEAIADSGDISGVVAVAALFFGTRISELIDRPVRDLDDGGMLLWIPDSKTENGERYLDIPPSLSPRLMKLAEGKSPDDRLFGDIDRHVAFRMVRRVCKAAGVPMVGPHGLRGTHTSIARERGATGHLIAAAVGHGSYSGVTQQHYIRPGLEEQVQQRQVLRLLSGGKR